MAETKDIFILLLLFSASVLCFMLIYFVFKISKSVEALQNDFRKVADQMAPLLESLNSLSRTIKVLSDDIRRQLDKTNWIIDEVKTKVEALIQFENRIKESMEHPAQTLKNTLASIKSGITTFFQNRKKNLLSDKEQVGAVELNFADLLSDQGQNQALQLQNAKQSFKLAATNLIINIKPLKSKERSKSLLLKKLIC